MSSRKEQKEQARQDRMAAEQAAAGAQTRSRRLKIIGAVVGGAAIVVLVAVLVSLGGGSVNSVEGSDDINARLDGIPQAGIALGKKDAPVTLVEFADLKCPYCRDFSNNALPTIIDDYIKTGKVRIELQLQTFLDQATPGTPDSTNAATMTLASGFQNKLWNFAEIWYFNQKEEGEVAATDAWLREIGASIPGLDVDKAMADRKDPKIDKQLEAASTAMADAGFTGTPAFLIGKTGETGEELTYSSLDSPDDFVTAIDLALSEAE